MPQPVLISRRLILRPLASADIPALVRLANDAEISRNTARVSYPYTRVNAASFLALIAARNVGDDISAFAVLRSNPALPVGMAGMHAVPRQPGAMLLGYWIGRAYRRRGFAGEAARRLIAYAFGLPGIERIHISCKADNIGSQRLIEALGSRFTHRNYVRSALFRRRVLALNYILTRQRWEAMAKRRKAQPPAFS